MARQLGGHTKVEEEACNPSLNDEKQMHSFSSPSSFLFQSSLKTQE
jgi:hypothetical protein